LAGPCKAELLSAVLRGGKRQFGGKVAYTGCIRSRKTVLCAHGALARHLIHTFTMRSCPFPDPADTDIWRHTPLWAGNDPRVSISYTQHLDVLKAYLLAAAIIVAKKTHLFRVYKARDLDEQGVDDEVRWQRRRRGWGP
jgi:hypothetical protein